MSFLGLYSWAMWDMMRPRKLITMLVCALVGPLFAAIIGLNTDSSELVYGMTMPLAVYQFTMILLSIVFAAGIVSSEMMGKTISFLLTRPIPRYKILLAKWLAAITVTTLATLLSAVLTALVSYGGNVAQSPIMSDLWLIPLGVIAYCSIFTMMSALSTKPWLFAVTFGFLWETIVPFLPGDMKALSVMAQLRAIGDDASFQSVPGGAAEMLSVLNTNELSSASALNTLIVITALTTVIACVVFSISEYVPKDETA